MIHFYVVVWQPQIITVVLKVHMHCEACAQEIKKRILRMKGLSFFFKRKINFEVHAILAFSCDYDFLNKNEKVVIMKYESVGNQRSCPFV